MMTTYTEYLEKCKSLANGYVVAAMTHRYLVDTWPMKEDEINEEKLLEVRVFNKDMDLKLFRSDISKEFTCRLINDKTGEYYAETDKILDYSDYSDEYQYLDIDTQESKNSFKKNKMVRTTGGGIYRLPMNTMDDVMVQIRMYFDKYTQTGQARVFDWRVVDFVEEGGR